MSKECSKTYIYGKNLIMFSPPSPKHRLTGLWNMRLGRNSLEHSKFRCEISLVFIIKEESANQAFHCNLMCKNSVHYIFSTRSLPYRSCWNFLNPSFLNCKMRVLDFWCLLSFLCALHTYFSSFLSLRAFIYF